MTRRSPNRRNPHDDPVDCPDCESGVFVYRREGRADGWQCGLCGWKSWIHGVENVDQEEMTVVDRGDGVATDGGVETDRLRVERSSAITYGPAVDAGGYVLAIGTADRRVEIELDEDAMYTLWTEVKGTPWPERELEDQKNRLVRQVLHAAQGADVTSLYDALRLLGGERR